MRFWSHVKVAGPDECWEWQRSFKHYPQYSIDAKPWKAWQVAYMLLRGDLPSKPIRLSCRNHACVNPAHVILRPPPRAKTPRISRVKTEKVDLFYISTNAAICPNCGQIAALVNDGLVLFCRHCKTYLADYPSSPRKAEILKKRDAGESLDKIGQAMGITRERVSQILGPPRTRGIGTVRQTKKSTNSRRLMIYRWIVQNGWPDRGRLSEIANDLGMESKHLGRDLEIIAASIPLAREIAGFTDAPSSEIAEDKELRVANDLGAGLTKAARLIVAREIIADWPDCPSRFLGEALGVTMRSGQRYLKEVPEIERLAGPIREQVLAHRDPDWLGDDDVVASFGWSLSSLRALGRRLPDARRLFNGRRVWHAPTLQAYIESPSSFREGKDRGPVLHPRR